MKFITATAFAAALFVAGPAVADGHIEWKSVADESTIAFGSVKKDTIGEVHEFTSIEASVSEEGAVTINIALDSVETYIDIRNERMVEHVFDKGAAKAVLSGSIDMDEVNDLAAGDTAIVDFEGKLSLAGIETDIEAEMLVARLSDTRVLVTTANFIMLSTADLGIDAGIDKLMQLAKLPGITRVTPVTARVVFEQ